MYCDAVVKQRVTTKVLLKKNETQTNTDTHPDTHTFKHTYTHTHTHTHNTHIHTHTHAHTHTYTHSHTHTHSRRCQLKWVGVIEEQDEEVCTKKDCRQTVETMRNGFEELKN